MCPDRRHEFLGLDTGAYFEILAVDLEEPRREFPAVRSPEDQRKHPVFLGLEGVDRPFALDYEPQCDRLDAPGARTFFDPRPE